MFLLSDDVVPHCIDLRKADGENAVAPLPCEILQVWVFGFNPEGGAAFEFFNHVRRVTGASERAEEVNVVLSATDDDGLAIQIAYNSAEVKVQFIAQGVVAQERAAVLCRKNCVYRIFESDCGIGVRVLDCRCLFNPFRVRDRSLDGRLG